MNKKLSKMPLMHVATRIFNVPLLIHPDKMQAILAVIGPRLGLRKDMVPVVSFDDMDDDMDDDQDEDITPGKDNDNDSGVALIQAHGTLVKRGGLDPYSGMTAYNGIRAKVQMALADPNCKAMLFDIDSPGGEAAGLFDLCKFLDSVKGQKPMVGIANDAAYSAAYCLGSCMDRLLVTGVGGVGSVGVYMLHMDRSQQDRENGLTYTYIYSGKQKIDGNPHEPLADDVKAKYQGEVNRIRDMFVAQVASGRGVDTKKIYDTEAATYMGSTACPLMADGVGTIDDAVALATDMIDTKAKRSIDLHVVGEPLLLIEDEEKPLAFHSTTNSSSITVGATTQFEAELPTGLLVKRQLGTLSMLESVANSTVGAKISGLLAPYDKPSCDLGGFVEVYKPGCFSKFLRSGADALVLGFHNPQNVLGRRANDTARFWEEADGLHYEADLPDTQFAKDLAALVRRGDVSGSSAAFYITRHHWETRGGTRTRVVEEAELVEGSPHSLVAYEKTTATIVEDKTAAAAHDTGLARARLRLLKLN